MLRFFDNIDGVVRCIFFKLMPLERADTESLFKAIDQNFTPDGSLTANGKSRAFYLQMTSLSVVKRR